MADFLTRARLDISDFESGIRQMLVELSELQTRLEALGQGAAAANLGEFGKKQHEGVRRSVQAIDELIKRYETLAAIQQRMGTQKSVAITPEEQQALGGLGGQKQRLAASTVENQIAKATNAIEAERVKLLENQAATKEQINQVSKAAADRVRTVIQDEARAIISGDKQNQIVRERLRLLDQERDKLNEHLAIVQSQVAAGLGTRKGGRLEDVRDRLGESIVATQEKQLKLAGELDAAEQRLANASTSKQRKKAHEDITQILQRQQAAAERLAALQEKLQNRPGAAGAQLDLAAVEGGAAEEQARIKQELLEIGRLQEDVLVNGLQNVSPRYAEIAKRMTVIQAELNRENIGRERTNELLREQAQLILEARGLETSAPGQGIKRAVDPEVFRQQQFAQFSTLERTFASAFDDMGRRFTATLQFAISGALIFGVQRFVREFAEAAMDVERTFADIASAMEFDLADEGLERGTAAFDRRIEEFRRGVVDLSNEFNVLPEVANKAAYQMTARFGETNTAMKAVRAQLLATKVSTIDQSEALRALTATAEGFAAAVLESNDAMTFQERLLERERVAAEGYGAALDEAVYIQQRFGIEVEDTLEGTARAAETFRQLGFTRQETEATVAAVAFQLGQTGQNVAERLNRAFAGITNPEVRDALLELAAASDEFKLSLSDFDSGAGAIQKIDAQIRKLQQTEPGTALGIRDILGQRRETEVVAAFFGTADLRRAIETSLVGAAGAAERRFGFIEATVTEQIQSILVKFQEMAQLFERIGGLSPFKLALGAAEGFLTTVNEILKVVQGVFEWLDRIGEAINVRIGKGLSEALSIMIALSTTMAALSAAAFAFRLAAATQAGVQAAQAAALSGAQGGAILTAGAQGAALRNTASAGLFGVLGRGFGEVGAQVKQSTGLFSKLNVAVMGLASGIRLAMARITGGLAAMLTKIPGWSATFGRNADNVALWTSRIALAAGATLLFAKALESSVETGREAEEGAGTARTEARTARQRMQRLEEFPEGIRGDLQADAFELGEYVNNLKVQAQENMRGGLETALVSVFPVFDEAVREQLGGWGPALGQSLRSLGPDAGVEKELIRGSEEWWKALINKAQDSFLQAQIDEIQAGINEFSGGTPPELPDFTFDPTQPFAAPNILDPRQQAQRELNAAETALAEAQESGSDEKYQAAQARVESAREKLAFLEDQIGNFVETWEGTLKGILSKVDNIQSGAKAGRIPAQFVPFLIEDQMTEMERLRNEILKTENATDRAKMLEEWQNEMDGLIVDYADGIMSAFVDREFDIGLIEDPVRQLEARLAMLLEQYRRLSKVVDSEEAKEVARQIRQTQIELADAVGDAAITAAQQQVAMAKTTEQWVKAMKELNQAMDAKVIFRFIAQLRQLDFTNLFDLLKIPGMVRDLVDDLQGNDFDQAQNDQEVADRLLDEAQRRAAASVRLSNPIRNRIAAVESQIASLNVLLTSGTLSGVELMEAQVQMQELLADRVEAQQAQVAAYIRLQAGHNNRIKELQADITIMAKNLEFTANAYGELSQEYSEMALAHDKLKYELVQAMLSLEDLQRRLGSDITNQFEQAQLDLVAVLAELANAGDLGELEKAQLELKKAQAEAAAEKAFFDDRLFQLRYMFETGALSLDGYKAALQKLLESVDTSTQQGKETFLQIQSLIEGLTNDISDMAFNIPAEIRLPTLFEVRRALAADQMGVNYMDNRTVEVNVAVTSVADLEEVLRAVDDAFGESAMYQFSRSAPGGSGIYAGGF